METTALIVVLLILLVMLLLRAPIAIALIMSAVAGLLMIDGVEFASQAVASIPFRSASSFFLILVPLYILMGVVLAQAGLTDELYRVAGHVFRRVPGAVGISTIAACAGFAAVTGSSIATAATMARTSIHSMVKSGYPVAFAAGIVAAGGTLGVLIPPSVVLVLYAVIAEESVGSLLIAGLIPGAVTALAYAGYVVYRERRLPTRSTPATRAKTTEGDSQAERLLQTLDEASGVTDQPATGTVDRDGDGSVPYGSLAYVAVIFGIVLAGIYGGYFTVMEAGAVAAVIAVFAAVMKQRLRRKPVRGLLASSFSEAMSITSMVILLLIGGSLLSHFLVRSGATSTLTGWVAGLDVSPHALLIIVLLIMLPLGMVLDPLSVIVIVVPVAHPMMTALGFDGIWFGIIFVRMIEIAMVTPPVGLNVYVVAGAGRVPVQDVFRGVLPFVGVDLVVVGILIAFPQLVTYLPELIR